MLSLMFWRDWSLSYRNAKIWARCRWGFCLSSPNFPLSSGTWINQETESTLSSVSLPGPLLASSIATVVALLWHWISSIAKENPGPRSWPTSYLWHEHAKKRKFWVPTRIPTWVPRIMWPIYFVFLYLSIVQFRTLLISFSLPHAFRMFNDLVYALTRTFRCSLVGITSPELAEVADVRIINSRGGLVLFFHFYLSLEMDNFIHSKACSTITVFPCSDSLIWTLYRRGRGRVSRIGYSWETVIIYHRGRGVGVFGGFWLCHNNFTWSALKAF